MVFFMFKNYHLNCMKDFIIYFKTPSYIRNVEINWIEFCVLFFLLIAILSLIVIAFTHVFKFEYKAHHSSVVGMFLSTVLLAPLFEESLHRFLLKPTLKNLTFYPLIILPMTSLLVWKQRYITFTVVVILVLLVLLLLWKRRTHLFKVQRKFIRYFAYIFYFSTLSFGLVHLANFTFNEINSWIVLICSLLVMPQFVAGSIVGYIRMKYGFLYAILFHTLINGTITFFVALKAVV